MRISCRYLFISSCFILSCFNFLFLPSKANASIQDQSHLPHLTLALADQYYQTKNNLLQENRIENLEAFQDVKIVLIPGIATELVDEFVE